MNADELPGIPVNVKLKCPHCGWGFDSGLREVAKLVKPSDGPDLDKGFTCCSKCLTNIEFEMDGTDVRILTAARIASLPSEIRLAIWQGQYLTWLAQQMEREGKPLQ